MYPQSASVNPLHCEPRPPRTLEIINSVDKDGNPAGGFCVYNSYWNGLNIQWQNGPLCVDGVRQEPNGAFVEEVLQCCIYRMQFYQNSKFACDYNQRALEHMQAALTELNARTADREQRSVEGTHAT